MRAFFLTTDRLGFSVWTENDLDLATVLWGDPQVTRFIVSCGRMSPDKVRERLGTEIECQNHHGIQYWPLFLRENDEFVGCCGLRPHGADSKALEMGVHLIRAQWHKGLATEACSAIIRWAFDHQGVEWLFAGHNPNNRASARLLLGLGFHALGEEFYPPTGLMHPSYRLDRF
jgi:[ribosomal protein S5]-alanine N-acetyltransferase